MAAVAAFLVSKNESDYKVFQPWTREYNAQLVLKKEELHFPEKKEKFWKKKIPILNFKHEHGPTVPFRLLFNLQSLQGCVLFFLHYKT